MYLPSEHPTIGINSRFPPYSRKGPLSDVSQIHYLTSLVAFPYKLDMSEIYPEKNSLHPLRKL